MPVAADRAFTLLRAKTALRPLLARAARRGRDGGGAERVALPLTDDVNPPHLIVTVAGDGVTCLAPGMAFAAPTLAFAEVTRLIDEEERLLRAQVVSRSYADDDDSSPLARLVRFPHRLTREELGILRTLAPLTTSFLLDQAWEFLAVVTEVKGALKNPIPRDLDRIWNGYMFAVMAFTVAGFEECAIGDCMRAIGTQDVHVAVRGLFHVVNQPERTLAWLEKEARSEQLFSVLARAIVLPALALRHPVYRRDVIALLRKLDDARVADALGDERWAAVNVYARSAPWIVPIFARFTDQVDDVPPDEIGEHARRAYAAVHHTLDFREIAAAVSPRHHGLLDLWRPLATVGTPPQLTLRATASLDEDTRVSVNAWRGHFHTWPVPLLSIDVGLIYLWSLAPLEAITPGDEPDPLWRQSAGRDYVVNVLSQFRLNSARFTSIRSAKGGVSERPWLAGTAARAEPKVGRNEPCPCGSGKKFKKCCAA